MRSELLKFGPYCLKRSGRVLAKSLTFDLPAGCFLELRGDNGAGKTSLLRTLAGLGDVNDKYADIKSRSVFYFAHHTGFSAELTVLKQLDLSLQMLGVQADAKKLLGMLEVVGLSRAKTAQVRTLSHGQWRRLGLAVMAGSGCQLWLIDEPLNALDVNAKALFADLLKVHLEHGGMAIVATHQALSEALPSLATYCHGVMTISGGSAIFNAAPHQQQAVPKKWSTENKLPMQAWAAFLWAIRREAALLMAKPLDVLWPALFFAMVVTMFPLAVGAVTDTLSKIAAGVFWMAALLSVLMAASRLFSADDESGALVQIRTARLSMSAFCAAKIVSNSLYLGVPMVVLSYILATLYHLPLVMMHSLALALFMGLFSLTAFAALFAALGLMARQSQVMMSLLAFPIFVPLLIFGAAASSRIDSQMFFTAPMWVMLSLACLTLLALPYVTAKALDLAIE